MRHNRPAPTLVRCLLVLTVLLPLLTRTGEAPAAPAQGIGAIGRANGSAEILNRYDAYFVEASATYAFPANLIKAVAWVEGGWTGTSPSGAVGIMQIIPGHWGVNALRLGYDIYTSHGNILMGTYILNYNLRTYGSYEQAVRHYLGVGVDPVTGISNDRYWEMVKERWATLNAAPVAKPIVDPELKPNPDMRGRDPYRARDGNHGSSWYVNGTPQSAILQIDLGATIRVSSIWWIFRIGGAADRFAVQVSLDGNTWQTAGRFGNAPAKRWQMVATTQKARYVRLLFANPNADPVVGYVAELEVYGRSVAASSAATVTPSPTKKATRTATPAATRTASPTRVASPSMAEASADCTASPAAARYATSVAVSCAGFAAGERVQLFWETTKTAALGSFTADDAGSGSGTLQVPEAPGGGHEVWALGETSGARVKIAVTVKPRASLDAASGANGRRVKLMLHGFQPGEVVTIDWLVSPDEMTTLARDLVASPLGNVAYTLTVPSASLGAHKFDGRGERGSRASASFTVTGADGAAATAPPMSSEAAPVTSPTATETPTATSTAEPTSTVAPTETLEPTATPTETPTEAPSPTPDPTPPDPSPTTTTAPVQE